MNIFGLSLGSMALVLLTLLSTTTAEVMRLDYEGFTVWLDCDKRGAVKFRYNAQRDAGDFKRHTTFMKQSNYMVNVLPQAANLNRGAWLHTEEITECYRDIDELLIIGGVIWGDDATDDHFVQSHGVATPSAFWKMIIRGTDRVIAWVVPNTKEATYKRLDQYLVTVEELEQRTGEVFPEVPEFVREEKPEVSWIIPIGCNKS